MKIYLSLSKLEKSKLQKLNVLFASKPWKNFFWPPKKLYNVHLLMFIRCKSFYATPPTEREKKSCLCVKCQNAHLRLTLPVLYI